MILAQSLPHCPRQRRRLRAVGIEFPERPMEGDDPLRPLAEDQIAQGPAFRLRPGAFSGRFFALGAPAGLEIAVEIDAACIGAAVVQVAVGIGHGEDAQRQRLSLGSVLMALEVIQKRQEDMGGGPLVTVHSADKERAAGGSRETSVVVQDQGPVLLGMADEPGLKKRRVAGRGPGGLHTVQTMKLNATIKTLHPRNVFRISRAARGEVQNIFVKLSSGGVTGWGEASPNAFYDETAFNVVTLLEAAAPLIERLEIESVADIERTWAESWLWFAPSRAAQCAFDLTLWDWLARKKGVSVAELAWGVPPHPVRTFCTIGLSDALELERKTDELRDFPLIKLKSDAAAALEPVAYVARRTGAALAVDANCAWGDVDIGAVSSELARLGVLFLEQPLSPADDELMPGVLAASRVPILADESCVTQEDVEALPGSYSGFNLKLVKCGGLTPALAMARRGRALGLRTMVGCMLESSLLIAAGMVAAQQTDFADLDGAWLLRDDPFTGLALSQGVLTPGPGPGFGVEPAPEH